MLPISQALGIMFAQVPFDDSCSPFKAAQLNVSPLSVFVALPINQALGISSPRCEVVTAPFASFKTSCPIEGVSSFAPHALPVTCGAVLPTTSHGETKLCTQRHGGGCAFVGASAKANGGGRGSRPWRSATVAAAHGSGNVVRRQCAADDSRLVIVSGVVAQWVVYFVLAVWLDNVLPNENGVRRPGWYFLLPSYWGLGGRANLRHRKMAATAMCASCVTYYGCLAESVPPLELPAFLRLGLGGRTSAVAGWPAASSQPRIFVEAASGCQCLGVDAEIGHLSRLPPRVGLYHAT